MFQLLLRCGSLLSWNMFSNLLVAAVVFNLWSWDNKRDTHRGQTFRNPSSSLTIFPTALHLSGKCTRISSRVTRLSSYTVDLTASTRAGFSVDIEGLALHSSLCTFVLPFKNDMYATCGPSESSCTQVCTWNYVAMNFSCYSFLTVKNRITLCTCLLYTSRCV